MFNKLGVTGGVVLLLCAIVAIVIGAVVSSSTSIVLGSVFVFVAALLIMKYSFDEDEPAGNTVE
jgi:uncharacterized membrane protein YoaK (UPF0700 family)